MLLIAGMLYFSSLCGQCGPAVEPSTSLAIIKVESGGNPYAIGDNTERKSYAPRSKEEAVTVASKLLAQGHNIDMGLMQINSIHLRPMKLSLDEVFDPCRNIKAGSTILADFYRRNDRPGEDKITVLYKALSAYNTGSAWRGPGYINKILQAAGVGYRVALNGSAPKADSRRKAEKPKKEAKRQGQNSLSLTGDGSSLFCEGTGGGGGKPGI
ncbi:lytic transglycosylase domain-containing protein [Geobacter grbiciae]|uniref:lytic transglycosylase domain-containing protein n=1 Tax=Geobacter grbiciae TaxID=155042 RepID=UPI001C01536B|nr:lytic transglycosylase domain-containing protein [Geobacter grbiciae]MBT1077205.1 lytic transglycosylase domain-containing protein [Geobacter grbiciae]